MKVQLIYDSRLIAEALTSVQETMPERCKCCGRMKARTWQLRQNDEAISNIVGILANTRIEVRMEPE